MQKKAVGLFPPRARRAKSVTAFVLSLTIVFGVGFAPFGLAPAMAASGNPTPVLTEGKITGYNLAVNIDPDEIRFNNLEWTGAASVSAGLPNQGRQSQVFEINREKPHATLMPYDTVDEAVKGAVDYDKSQSKYYMPLTTPEDLDPLTSSWTFSRVDTLTTTLATANATKDPRSPSQNIVDFYKPDYDASNWPGIAVPTSWQAQGIGPDGKPYTGYYDPTYGYDPPYYVNTANPGTINFRGKTLNIFNGITIPGAPTVFNPVGFYRKTFDVPSGWIDGKNKVFISFDGVEAAFYVYLNGKEVGYHEDSKTPGEFDLTPFLTENGKDNLLAVKVLRWADCSWMDDQDFIRLGGIFRDVYLMATPALHIRDYKIETKFDSTYTNATLSLDVWARNYTTGMDFSGYSVTAQLFAPDGTDILAGNTFDLGLGGLLPNSEVKASGQVQVLNPHKWFPDDPYLYTLVLSVYDKATNVAVERISQQFGFKEITYRDADNASDIIRINGQKVMMFGVNRHDSSPYGGHYVSPETYETDLRIMKRNNINTIRTSHYPNDTYLYYLADKYGIMVLDEANNESHANTSTSITTDNFFAMANSRMINMVERDKNVTSVIMWSLGNESGNQAGFRTIIANARQVDNSRPFHYEAFGNNTSSDPNQNNDVRSSMYTGVSGYQSNCRSSALKSVMLCEYNHANGNALGILREYTDVFRSEPRSIGGCIWDYVDQSVWTTITPVVSGKIAESSPYAMTGVTDLGASSLFADFPEYGRVLKPGAAVTYENTAGTGGQDIFNEYISGRQPFSIEVWASLTDTAANRVLIAKGDNHFSLKTDSNGNVQFVIYSSGTWVSARTAIPPSFTDGKMHRWVGTFDGTSLRLYYDGVLQATTALTASQNVGTSAHAFSVGRDVQNGSGRDSVSYIAGARVFARALSTEEAADMTRKPSDACPSDDNAILFWADYTKGELTEEVSPTWDYYGNGMYLGYSGDWGENNSDGNGCADGIITAMREEQPEIAEAKKCYQYLNFTATNSELLNGIINVRNEYYAKNGNEFDYNWILTENGVEIGRGTLADVPSIPAAQNGMDVFFDLPTVALNVPYTMPAALRPGAEYFLTIEACMKSATEWADAGYCLASEQFKIPVKVDANVGTIKADHAKAIILNENESTLTLTGDNFTIDFSKTSGLITNFTVNGEKLLTEGPKPSFWRSTLKGDKLSTNGWTNVDLNLPTPVFSAALTENGLSSIVKVTYPITAVNASSFIDMTYTVYLNGAVKVDTAMRTTDTSQIYRFGVDMIMPGGYEDVQWLTRGPQDNFNDRIAGAYVGLYNTTVSDNYFAFINAPVGGQHVDTRWMALTGEGKDMGLLIVATGDKNFEANAQHFGWRSTLVRHPYNLKRIDGTVVGVSLESRGAGCGQASTLSQYQVTAGNKSYSYTLVPFASGAADLQTLADTYKSDPIFDFGYEAKNTGTIVSGYSANVMTSLTQDGNPVGAYTVTLFGKDYPGGIIRLVPNDLPEPGKYMVTYKIGGEVAAISSITVEARDDSIWKLYIGAYNADSTVLTFHAVISLKDNYMVRVNGKPRSSHQEGNAIVIEDYNPRYGDVLTVSGVKYPILFPSYSFTFTQVCYPTLQFEAENLPYVSNKAIGLPGTSQAGARNQSYLEFAASAEVGDYIEFTISDIPTGKYEVVLGYKLNTNRGACQLYVDGVPLGDPVDQTGPSNTFSSVTIGTLTLSPGVHSFKFVVSKNGTLVFDYIDLIGVE